MSNTPLATPKMYFRVMGSSGTMRQAGTFRAKVRAGYSYSSARTRLTEETVMRYCVVLIVGLLSVRATAAVINVPADQTTIQAAIDIAVNGDEIIVAPGSYFEHIDFIGKAVFLHSSAGAATTIIDGGGVGPVVNCTSFETNATIS